MFKNIFHIVYIIHNMSVVQMIDISDTKFLFNSSFKLKDHLNKVRDWMIDVLRKKSKKLKRDGTFEFNHNIELFSNQCNRINLAYSTSSGTYIEDLDKSISDIDNMVGSDDFVVKHYFNIVESNYFMDDSDDEDDSDDQDDSDDEDDLYYLKI